MDFDTPEETGLLKTLREKEKILVTSIISFLHNVFNPIKDNFDVLKSFLIFQLQILSIWTKTKFCHLVKGLRHDVRQVKLTVYSFFLIFIAD